VPILALSHPRFLFMMANKKRKSISNSTHVQPAALVSTSAVAAASSPSLAFVASLLSQPAVAAVSIRHEGAIIPLPEQFPLVKKPRRGRSSKFEWHLPMLANVELQLILHFCTNVERLKCATVSRRMLHALQQPFSWRGASLFRLSSSDPEQFPLVASSLIRFAPTHFSFDSWLDNSDLALLPSLFSMKLSDVSDAAQAEFLFQLPALQHVVEIHLSEDQIRNLQPLARLHKLQSLTVRDAHSAPANFFQPLRDLPHLTHVSVHMVPKEGFPSIACCSHLLKLKIEYPPDTGLRTLLCSPSMAALEELSLENMFRSQSSGQIDFHDCGRLVGHVDKLESSAGAIIVLDSEYGFPSCSSE
jgi:hypothetical protein